MAQRKKRKPPKAQPGQEEKPCATYRAERARGFTRSLDRLGIEAAIDIPAELEGFMKDVREYAELPELQSSWDYKLLQGRDARRSRTYQIRVCTHYRVALITSQKICRVFFLNAYRRTGNNQSEIATAVQRALDIRESLDEL